METGPPIDFYSRDFGVTAVRECMPETSNSLLQDWLTKGLAEADREDIGANKSVYRFSAQDVTHLMLLGHLSRYGLLRSPERVEVRFAHKGEEGLDAGYSLYDVPRIRTFCTNNGYRVGTTVYSLFAKALPTQITGEARSKRAKRGFIQYVVTLHPLADMRQEAEHWLDPACARSGFRESVIFLSVARLCQEATTTLLGEPWADN